MRAQAFAKFADALEKAAAGVDGRVRARPAAGEAYLAFALKNPHAYRIMFDIDAPIDESHPELGPAAERAARYITSGAEQMAAAGVIGVDPQLFGWSMWAAIHGIVMLHQSGMLAHGPDYRTLSGFLGGTMLKGAAQDGHGPKEEEAMTAGVISGERFRSWADIQANAARAAGGFARSASARTTAWR